MEDQEAVREAFQRYRRSLKNHPHMLWTQERVDEYDDDHRELRAAYKLRRKGDKVSFDIATERAHEDLFLMMLKEAEDGE